MHNALNNFIGFYCVMIIKSFTFVGTSDNGCRWQLYDHVERDYGQQWTGLGWIRQPS
jgi:hypothetical protein